MNLVSSLQTRSVSPVETCKATVFKIAEHWFALPATAILKIIPSSVLENNTAHKLTVWNNQPLVRLDLHQLLTRTSVHRSSQLDNSCLNSCQYMMIVWSQTGERCGIPVDELPTLHELSLSTAQVLPAHYRQSICNIAKYLVIHPHQGIALNVLLLDLQQALNRVVNL